MERARGARSRFGSLRALAALDPSLLAADVTGTPGDVRRLPVQVPAGPPAAGRR